MTTTAPPLAELEKELEELVYHIVETLDVPVPYSKLLFYLKARRIPTEIADRAIWHLIETDRLDLDFGNIVIPSA